MSGIWMMASQGPDPEDNLTTTYILGLDKLRRQTAVQMLLSSVSMVLVSVAIAVTMWGRAQWWEIAIFIALVLVVFSSAAIAGAFVGRLSAFKDLARARVRVEQVDLEGDE